MEIKSEQLKEEAITHGGETTTLKSKLENARQSQEDNRARIQALENATPKPKGDLINSILIRLARLEDNQSELIRGFNPPAYPPRTYDKVTRSSPSVGGVSGTHEGEANPDHVDNPRV